MLNKKWLNDQILNVTDNFTMSNFFYTILFMLFTNRFVWKNLPNNIDRDFIEKTIQEEGKIAFFNHPTYGLVATKCSEGDINIYGKATNYLCYSDNNAIYEIVESSKCCIIRNNNLSLPSTMFILRYAQNLADIKKTKEVNRNALKTPLLLLCPENQRQTMLNLYEKYEGNSPVIFGNKNIGELLENNFKVLDTKAECNLDKLQDDFNAELSECLKFGGINITPEKGERLISQEMECYNDLSNSCLGIYLTQRLEGIKELNKMFNCNVELELVTNYKEIIENVSHETLKEGD